MTLVPFDGELDAAPKLVPFDGRLDDEPQQGDPMGTGLAEMVSQPTSSGSVLENLTVPQTHDPELNRQAMQKSVSPGSVMFDSGRARQQAEDAIAREEVRLRRKQAIEDAKRDGGAGESLARGAGRGFASTGKTLGLLTVAPTVVYEKIRNAVTGSDDTSASDAAFASRVDPFQQAEDWYKLGPNEKQDFLGKVADGVGGMLADLPLMIASGGLSAETAILQKTPALAEFLSTVTSRGFDAMRPVMVKAATDKAQQVLDAGGSVPQALVSATTAALVTGFTGAQPMSAEGNVAQRLLSGIPVGATTGEAHRLIQNAADPANIQQPFSWENVATSALTNAIAAGAMGHAEPGGGRDRIDLGYDPTNGKTATASGIADAFGTPGERPTEPGRAQPARDIQPDPAVLGAGSADEAIDAAMRATDPRADAVRMKMDAIRPIPPEEVSAAPAQQPAATEPLAPGVWPATAARPREVPAAMLERQAENPLLEAARAGEADRAAQANVERGAALLERQAAGEPLLSALETRRARDDAFAQAERAREAQRAGELDAVQNAAVGENLTSEGAGERTRAVERAADLAGPNAMQVALERARQTETPDVRTDAAVRAEPAGSLGRGGADASAGVGAGAGVPVAPGRAMDQRGGAPRGRAAEPVSVGVGTERPAALSALDPVTVWTGRRGDGYATRIDAETAMQSRQRAAPELEWRVQARRDGRFELAGFQPTGTFSTEEGFTVRANGRTGTVSIDGEPQAVLARLSDAGVDTSGGKVAVGRSGVLVGTSQARQALEALMQPAAEEAAPRAPAQEVSRATAAPALEATAAAPGAAAVVAEPVAPAAANAVTPARTSQTSVDGESARAVAAAAKPAMPTASWVIRDKATGEPVMETFDRAKVDALNTAKYEAVPVQQYLSEINDPQTPAGKLARGERPSAANLDATDPFAPPTPKAEIIGNPSGTITIKGDPAQIREVLKAAGITGIVPNRSGGLVVGKSQSTKAREVIQRELGATVSGKEIDLGDDPFRKFLFANGLNPKLAKDFAGGRTERFANNRMFRPDGLQLDALAERAWEQGFLADRDHTGQLYDMIARSFAGEKIKPEYSHDTEADLRSAYERHLDEQQDAANREEAEFRALMETAAEEGIDTESILEKAAIIAENGDSHDYRQAAHSLLEQARAGSSEPADRARAVQGRQAAEQGSVRPGGEGTGTEGAAGLGEGLTAPTREDILAQQQRREEGERAERTRQQQEEQRARADAERDDFTLTGSDRAADANPDQGGLFARGDAQPTGLTIAQARPIVDALTAKWKSGPTVHVVASNRDLPIKSPADVRGLYTPGNVWVVAGAHANEAQVRQSIAKTLAHDAVAHYGLRNMLGRDGWNQLMSNIQIAIKAGNKPLTEIRDYIRRAYVDDNGRFNLSPAREADEIAARVVEQAIDANGEFKPAFGFLKSTWARIATFLRNLGIDVKFTRAELQGMLVLANRSMEGEAKLDGGNQVLVGATAARDESAHARSEATDAEPPADLARSRERKPYTGPGGQLVRTAREAVSRITSDLQLMAAPMSLGSSAAKAVAKDYANAERLARWQWARFDDFLRKNFDEDQRRKMWEAADDENVQRMREANEEGYSRPAGSGLDALAPDERAAVETLHQYGEQLLQRAKDVGMFQGEGLPYWTPRMAVMIGESGEYAKIPGEGQTASPEGRGFNVTTSSPSLKQRKYLTAAETEAAASALAQERGGQGAQIVRDIRTMPMAMARLERAIAGRELVDQIKALGLATGTPVTSDREQPGFFTLDHPAFKTFVPKRVPIRISEYFDRKLLDGLMQVAENIGVRHVRKGGLRGGALGLAYKNLPLVETKFFTPDQVLTHEIGHQLDFKYGLAEQLTRRGTTAKELRALADMRYEGRENEVSDYYKAYVRKASEKIANLVHAYVHNPERFREVAPETFKWFDAFVGRTPELAPLKDLGPSLTIGKRDVDAQVTRWEQRPLFVSKDFEGPLKAVLSERSGDAYKFLMDLKGKSMGLIMYSPLIHNAVEWGRALPVMPGKVLTFKVYFEGNRIKNDPQAMQQAIDDGVVPIGHRGQMQDITGLAEEPTLAPGRSWTAKLLGGAIGAVNENAGTAVKKGIDTAGDFWHNTLLWDRVGDLQMGLYGNVKADLVRKGFDAQTAGRLAAHFANRYAGALPNEAMSANARKLANLVLFSRSFTLGNLGVMKDMLSGFPRDVAAQIQRDAGELVLKSARNVARRKAIAAFALDIALLYAGNSLLQSALDTMKRDKSLGDVLQGYAERFSALMKRTHEHPLEVLTSPMESVASLTPNSRNEPGKENRILYDTDEQGTNIYLRLPTGKIGEEFKDWLTSPLEMLARKQGTIMRPITQTLSNDKGFGQRVYDPDDKTWAGMAKNVGRIVMNFMTQQVPMESVRAARDWAEGSAQDVDKLKVLGPLAGVTFSKGAPGGPEVGEMYHENRVHQGKVADVMPDVRQALKAGDEAKARDLMESANMTPGEMARVIRNYQNPGARLSGKQMKDYRRHASEESKERMESYGR